jgi:hypothetical protein
VRALLLVLLLAGCASAPRYGEAGVCASALFARATLVGLPIAIGCALHEVNKEIKKEDKDAREAD